MEVCEGLGRPRSKIHQREFSEKEKQARQLDRCICRRKRDRERGMVHVSDQIKQRGKEEGFKSICNNVRCCL